MKKILIFPVFILSGLLFSQIAIGKTNVSNSSVSLEFGDDDLGLILPWINSTDDMVQAVPGTMVFDASDKKFKLKTNNSWKDYSIQSGQVDLSLQANRIENLDAGVIIGESDSTTPDGILVLEGTDKVMVLPKVENPHLNIADPSPGLMVFDPTHKVLAFYNGQVWTFWQGDNE